MEPNVTPSTVGSSEEVTVLIPRDLRFTGDNLVSVASYSVLFFVAALGNLTVFITLFKNRHRKSRVNLFIMHLSIADLLVTFITVPIELSWHITVSWIAGDLACRILMFFRPFGFYLSSFILVGISLDRYFAITQPLSLSDADKRGKIMLTLAWLLSIVASTPQSVIFHVERHPHHRWFTQCVTFNFFPTPQHELVYNIFHMVAIYLAPLVIIIISYSLILVEISSKSRQSVGNRNDEQKRFVRPRPFRHSGIGRMEKARERTLKMTLVIVLVFVMCWTPYFVISTLWWFDKETADKLDPKIARGFFMFAVSNACLNPIVYGLFTRTVVRELRQCWSSLFCLSSNVRTQATALHEQSANRLLDQRKSSSSSDPKPTSTTNDTASWTQKHQPTVVHFRDGDHVRSNENHEQIAECDELQATPHPADRRPTPPHIAHGRGHRYKFEMYLFL